MFFAGLPIGGDGRQPFPEREEFLETSGDLYMSVRATLRRLEAEMDGLKEVDEAPGLKKRVARLRSELEFLLESSANNMVYWLERRISGAPDKSALIGRSGGIRSQSRTTFLQATPIDVSELLSELVFETIPTVVLTSATLTVQGGFEHMRKRMGLSEARELVVPSHFRYGEQALLYLPPDMPDPRDPEFPEAAARTIQRVLEITRGRASASSLATARCATSTSVCCRCSTFPSCCTAPRPARRCLNNSARPQRRPFRDIQFLARCRRARRSAELRHHRPLALRRPQRPGRCRAHESH